MIDSSMTYSRFIPGYAGNAYSARPNVTAQAVYPRLRGEHIAARDRYIRETGLSPATRGTPEKGAGQAHAARFIPGYAGNTSGSIETTAEYAVYPRLRGEHHWDSWNESLSDGLSPATRGTLNVAIPCLFAKRFIPGYAGNTSASNAGFSSGSVYPRLRGEHAVGRQCLVEKIGLSPATRGTPSSVYLWPVSGRFIPGYAGNTLDTSLSIYS